MAGVPLRCLSEWDTEKERASIWNIPEPSVLTPAEGRSCEKFEGLVVPVRSMCRKRHRLHWTAPGGVRSYTDFIPCVSLGGCVGISNSQVVEFSVHYLI